MAAVHHRMPVTLTPEEVAAWLDPAASRDDLAALLKPLPDDAVTLTPVSKRVNAVREDHPALLEEARLTEPPAPLALLCPAAKDFTGTDGFRACPGLPEPQPASQSTSSGRAHPEPV